MSSGGWGSRRSDVGTGTRTVPVVVVVVVVGMTRATIGRQAS